MSEARVKRTSDNRWRFDCPGCNESHMVNDSWGFNGDVERPTFTPSVLVRSGHYVDGHTGDCWCTFQERTGKESGFKCSVCHSFITNGRIQFLSDSTHDLAGQTVELPVIKRSLDLV